MKPLQQPLSRIIVTALMSLSFVAFLIRPGAVQSADGNKKSDPKGVEFECIGTYGETIQSCKQYSHYAFLNQGYTLRVLDVKDPTHPKEVFWRRFDNKISSMAIKFPALYLGFAGGDLLILDISNPARPSQRTTMGGGGKIYLKVMGHFLLAEDVYGKSTDYTIYNIKNPLNPIQRINGERQHGSAHGDEFIFATDGTRLFSVEYIGEIEDENRQAKIENVTTSSTTPAQRTVPVTEEFSFSVKGNKLVAGDSATSRTIPIAAIDRSATVWVYLYEEGIETIQEGQRPKPEKINMGAYGENEGVSQFKIAGDRGYLIDGKGGLQVLDMSDPAHPRCLGRKQIDNMPKPVIRAIEDNLVFISGKEPGYLILDCANPTSPTLRAAYAGPSGPMSIQDKRAYVAAGKAGLQILDLSKPNDIRMIGSYPTPNPASDLVTSGSLVYLLAKDLMIVDAANPAKPILIGKVPISFDEEGWLDEGGRPDDNGVQLKKLGTAVYAIMRGHGRIQRTACRVIDISNPAQPHLLPDQVNAEPPVGDDDEGSGPNSLSNPGTPSFTTGWYLCLPSSYSGYEGGWIHYSYALMTAFDLSDPFKPTPVYHTSAIYPADCVAIYKNTLYFADGPGGLVILRPVKKAGDKEDARSSQLR